MSRNPAPALAMLTALALALRTAAAPADIVLILAAGDEPRASAPHRPSPEPTPRIARWMAGAARFTNAFRAAPTVAASADAVLTGRHPARLKTTGLAPDVAPADAKLLPPRPPSRARGAGEVPAVLTASAEALPALVAEFIRTNAVRPFLLVARIDGDASPDDRTDAAFQGVLDAFLASDAAGTGWVAFTSAASGWAGLSVTDLAQVAEVSSDRHLRAPFAVSGPGSKAGDIAWTAFGTDVLPTLKALAGWKADVGPRDGNDLSGALSGAALTAASPPWWHFPDYHPMGGKPFAAIREDGWKLVQEYETGANRLYHPASDPGETEDVSSQHTAKVHSLARRLMALQGSVQAEWPLPNPAWARPVTGPAVNGTVELHARDALLHAVQLRYEPQPFKDTIGYWTRTNEWAGWRFEIAWPGTYVVEALQGCGAGHGGSEVEFSVGDQRLVLVVEETGHFQNFVTRRVGEVRLDKAGMYDLAVRPLRRPGGAVMDLRRVTLRPKAG